MDGGSDIQYSGRYIHGSANGIRRGGKGSCIHLGKDDVYIIVTLKKVTEENQTAIELLRKLVAAQGLFAPEHKVPIPRFPEKIGVITAPTGAAVRDIMSTIKRRYPMCEAILFPCLVQGKDAAPDIVRQIKRADAYGVDTIIVGRGGGSV